jgi:hypothetical protein
MIKSFSYSMIPFILADCPDVKATKAMKLSMIMMDGYKLKIFVMFLSFIGWGLLSVLTFGILHIVFVNPYMYATHAGYYVEIRDEAIATGKIPREEFGMLPEEPVEVISENVDNNFQDSFDSSMPYHSPRE